MTGARGVAVIVAAAIAAAGSEDRAAAAGTPHSCGWSAPQTQQSVVVKNAAELLHAVATARPDTTILLERGEYRLPRMLDVTVPGTVLRSAGGDRAAVVIRGDSMVESAVGVAVSISAPRVTLADVTIGWVAFHAVQVRGERGASHVTLHNVRLVDTGQQLLKGSTSGNGLFADHGLVACSRFEFTSHAPSSYTNGIDVLAGRGWTVRDSEFRNIRGPAAQQWSAGPAILFWANSQDTLIERNVIADSFRGIALGLGPGASTLPRDGERRFDHQRGTIRNNVVVNLAAWADEGIEANAAADTTIERNTVLVEGGLGWSISVRFPGTTGIVRRNLTNRRVLSRNGGAAALDGNVETADRRWFVDAAGADLRLVHASEAGAEWSRP